MVAALRASGVGWSTIGTIEAAVVGDGRKTVSSRDEGPASRGSSVDVGTESETERAGAEVEGRAGMLTCVPVREARETEWEEREDECSHREE